MDIDKRNTRVQQDAKRMGRESFQLMVVTHWPGCVECGQAIRNAPSNKYGGRMCGCPGVEWKISYSSLDSGWVREEVEADDTDNLSD